MQSSAQIGQERGIDPALKSFIDNCIVPALVKQYLAEFGPQKRIAESDLPVAVSVTNDGLSAERSTL